MPGRHLRRARGWWVRRALVVLAVLAVGASIGVAGWVVAEGDDGGVAAGAHHAVLAPRPGPVTLALAGEIGAGGALSTQLGQPDVVGPFGAVLAEADLSVADVSAAVADAPPPDAASTSWAPSTLLDALEATGVDVVSLGNDRSLDLGPLGLDATLAAAEGRRIDVVGVGPDEDGAYAPAVRDVGGVTVAVVGATQELDPARIATDTATADTPGVASAKRIDRLVAEVRAAVEVADIVVVYVHWGEPEQTCPSTSQRELASALADAGADVVAGTGALAVQGVGRLGDAVIAYGLGGLVTDGAVEGGVLSVEVDGGGVAGWRLIPGTVVEGVLRPLGEPDQATAADLAARQVCAGLSP